MSGSIGGNRINREDVLNTVISYEETVLKKFPGYKKCVITGSYNAGIKKDHGDIDLVVYIEGEDITSIKKKFKQYLDNLSDDITIPFKSGKRVGEKSQLFGQIVTCGYNIYSKSQYVQVDNIIVNSLEKLEFQNNFLNLSAPKQALLMGLVRVLGGKEFIEEYKSNKEFDYEFVLSPQGISFRELLMKDFKELKRNVLWKSYNWSILYELLPTINIEDDYEEILNNVSEYLDERSKRRIVGLIKSVINIGVGEVGTQKGRDKENAIKLAESILK